MRTTTHYSIGATRFARCLSCNGEGEQHFAHTDPERDWTEPCGDCAGRGEWRESPADLLERMAHARKLNRADYAFLRSQAMRRTLGMAQHRMVEAAIRLDVALRDMLPGFRQAVAA